MIVIDSSLLIAALSAKDKNHDRARLLVAEIRKGIWGQALLPDWVFVEVSNFVQRRSGREAAVAVARQMSDPEAARLVACSPLFEAAKDLFTSGRTGSLSFADVGVVMVARKAGVANVASYDGGFHAVPGLNVIQDARTAA